MLLRFLLIGFIATLTACGFHLKGKASLSPQLTQIYVLESSDKAFNKELSKQLKASGATLQDNAENVAFLSTVFKQEPPLLLAKSSTGLNILRLKISIDYSIKNNQGEWLAQQKTLSQIREFETNSDQLLARNKEKELLYSQMRQSLVRVLMYQLERLN